MAKRKLKLHVRIPHYRTPRIAWRKEIYKCIVSEATIKEVRFSASDKLQLEVRLYLHGIALSFHDVDNRLKDIMDALQGRCGGSKKDHTFAPIIPNDKQIFRVLIEKTAPPKQSKGHGHLIISRYVSSKIH